MEKRSTAFSCLQIYYISLPLSIVLFCFLHSPHLQYILLQVTREMPHCCYVNCRK